MFSLLEASFEAFASLILLSGKRVLLTQILFLCGLIFYLLVLVLFAP